MKGGLLPPPDLSDYTNCGYLLPSGVRCGKPAVASAEAPDGHRTSLCKVHAAVALRAVRDPRYEDWRVSA